MLIALPADAGDSDLSRFAPLEGLSEANKMFFISRHFGPIISGCITQFPDA